MDPGFVERGGEGQKVGSLQLVLLIKKNPQKGVCSSLNPQVSSYKEFWI